jgi:hypothetical protein
MLYRNSITIKSHNATIQRHIHVQAILCKSCASQQYEEHGEGSSNVLPVCQHIAIA